MDDYYLASIEQYNPTDKDWVIWNILWEDKLDVNDTGVLWNGQDVCQMGLPSELRVTNGVCVFLPYIEFMKQVLDGLKSLNSEYRIKFETIVSLP